MGNIDTSEHLYPSVYIIDEMVLPLYLEDMRAKYSMSWPKGDAYNFCYENLETIEYLAKSSALDRDRQLQAMYHNNIQRLPCLSYFYYLFVGSNIRQSEIHNLYEVISTEIEGISKAGGIHSSLKASHVARRVTVDWVIFTNDAARIGIDREAGLMLVYSGNTTIKGRITRFNNQPVVFAKEFEDGTHPRTGAWDFNIPNY